MRVTNVRDILDSPHEERDEIQEKLFHLSKGENWDEDQDSDFFAGPVVGEDRYLSDGPSTYEWLKKVLYDLPEIQEIGAAENYHLLRDSERSRDEVWADIEKKISWYLDSSIEIIS